MNVYETTPGYPDYSREGFEKERMKMTSYRDLEVGEIVQEGDELRFKNRVSNNWASVILSVGARVGDDAIKDSEYRRPLAQPEVLPGDDNCGCGSPLHDTHGNRKVETQGVSVELLIVDFGECCAINVVSGQFDYPMHPMFDRINFRGTAAILPCTFDEVKAAIDAAFAGEGANRPVPRLEFDDESRVMALWRANDPAAVAPLVMNYGEYKALSYLAGKDIQIWTPPQTKWERLGTPAEIQMWRFTTGA